MGSTRYYLQRYIASQPHRDVCRQYVIVWLYSRGKCTKSTRTMEFSEREREREGERERERERER